ncbi:MAG: hypothetical protein E7461_07465 [Ruminococcaceae bacterium]|nr:hypothetical protein [Oscillospiraceae bacterium]
MTNEQKLLIDTLACALTGKGYTVPENIDWRLFVGLSMRHTVAPLVYDGLRKNGSWEMLPPPGKKILSDAYHTAIFRDAQFMHLKEQLAEKLTQENVPHIFLKGASLKKDYPEPALRTMCDLDVLAHTEDYPKLDKIAAEMGAKAEDGDGNHHSFCFPGNLAVEFHPNLIHHDTPVGTQINPGWQYAATDGTDLTPEGFYLNTICHLANHFVSGGAGVRFIADVWVNRNLRKPEANWKTVEKELERFGLLDFARNIEELARCWFDGGTETPLLQEMGEYILSEGQYGSADRAIRNAAALSPGESGASALSRRVFPSKEELESKFPWCKGKTLLLPAAWCARCIRVVTKRGSLALKWTTETGKLKKEEITEQKAMLIRFGIQPEK